jgi:hypothetical protein
MVEERKKERKKEKKRKEKKRGNTKRCIISRKIKQSFVLFFVYCIFVKLEENG